ncbi:MAG: MG2 domain-containing protein [Paludibacteraceae bacterium]|nr:MG2 domain-containing protein [Paludibacteraceae bacterium]
MGNNTDYASKWNEVNNLMDKPLLQDAQKKVDEIRVAAKKEKDDLNILKCEIYDYAIEFGCEYNITSESKIKPGNANREEGEDIIIKHYDNAEKLLNSFNSPVEKACCELFMAKMLMNFIDVMKRYPGSVPSVKEDDGKQSSAEDLREMSHENLRNLIRSHVDNIIKNKETLLSTSSDKYNSLFVKSDAITDELKECRPSVFDVMLPSLMSFYYERIELYCEAKWFYLPINLVKNDLLKKDYLNSIFADVINYHNNKGEYSAALSAELSRLEYLEREGIHDDKLRLETLGNLIKQYEGKTSCVVNAVVKKQELLCNKLHTIDSTDNESYIKEIESYPKQILDEAEFYIKIYPNHSGRKQLESNFKFLNKVLANGSVERGTFGKGSDVKIKLKYANIDVLYAEIYNVDMSPIQIEKLRNREYKLKKGKLIAKKEFKLEPSNYVIQKDTVLNFGNSFDYGKYIVYIYDKAGKKEDNYVTFTVSNLSLLNASSAGSQRNILVVDVESGHPINKANVERYDTRNYEYNLKEAKNTSVDGKTDITLPDNHSYAVYAHNGKDIYAPWLNINKGYTEKERSYYKANIYTDRNIYRPGQTIDGKIIVTYLSKNDERVVDSQIVKLTLKDANYEKVDEIEVTTNEFGSAAFKFAIPSDRLNGTFRIEASYNIEKKKYSDSQSITVESYKLPVAQASVKSKDGSSRMYGNKLEFVGEVKTFSGEAVNGAMVKYTIKSNKLPIINTNNAVLSSGEVKCGDDGSFSIISDSAITQDMAYSVSLEADVVLPSGESVSAFEWVNLYEKAVSGNLNSRRSGYIEKHSKLSVTAEISNNAKINDDAEAIITVETKEDKKKNIESKILISKNIKGDGEITEEFDISILTPGVYEILLKTLSGEELDREEIIIYDKTSSKMPVGYESHLWIPNRIDECTPSKEAEFLIGSTEKDAKILAIVRDEDGNFLHSEWIDVNNEQKIYKVAFNKYFANNDTKTIKIEFIIVRNSNSWEESVTIKRKDDKQKQEIEILEIVRKIVPGEKQKVKMVVKPTDSNYEVAAVMVDKSLSEMLPRWITLAHYYTYHRTYNTDISHQYWHYFNIDKGSWYGSYQELPITKFLWENILMPEPKLFMMGSKSAMMSRKMAAPKLMRSMDAVEESIELSLQADYTEKKIAVMDDEVGSNGANPEPIPPAADFSDVKVRDNFVETAFFYPQLTTAADGSVEFEYTAPDALTAWRMIVFAHNKKANSCITSEDLQTQMPFAVKANLPRFVRKGDKCSFATTITNNDEKEKSGDVAIIIKDVATDKIISQQSRKFSLEGNKSKVEEWSFDVPAGVASIEVKMVGKSGTFSDGEVHQLPVLPDGTHVVKSKSMHVRGGEAKDFSIDYNEKEMKDAELIVEYTDNAVWQSLMALPSIKDARYECATEFISSVYVNQMAQRIALLYPEIKTVVEEWKKEGDHAASPLDQNQELKEVLMKQTPWMCEAKSESEQRAKIVELYDKDRITKANKDAISKLEKLQQADGGFAWFSGFKSSEYVTVAVAEKMVEMREYGVLPKECEKMLKNAVKYIDNALTEAYNKELVETHGRASNGQESNNRYPADREWLFDVFRIRISYDKNLSNNTKKILDYYVKKADKEIKEMTLFGKASFAIVLNMKGDEKEAKSIVESLRQSATNTEEFGMYWKGNQDSWGRYGNAISTHAMLTKAFMKTGCDAKELSDLRFHLITKKETTQWNNAQSTLAAIGALVGDRQKMDVGAGFKPARENEAIIKIGGKQVDAKRTSGDGYIKIHYDKDSFTPELCNIHVEQPQGQEGIGGIYISYDAPYTEITSGKSGIEIKKKMYKVVIANDGDDNKEMLQEIKEGEKLQKGDKVKIVMTLRSDRDIDFVQVLDLRAACLEPVRKRPGIEWADGKIYYQSITDSEYSMFFDRISKGTRVFEYTLHVTQSGEYTQGITKVIPHYCPAFGANSEGGKVLVK